MVKHVLFLRWLLIAAVTTVSAYFCYSFGTFQEILEKDWSYISLGIGIAFVFMTIWCGIKTYVLSHDVNRHHWFGLPINIKQTKNLEEIGWFMAESFQVWGFIGTVVGMIDALSGFFGIDPSDTTAMQKLLTDLAYGMSTALYTTLAGLVCSFLLKIQYMNLAYTRRKVENE